METRSGLLPSSAVSAAAGCAACRRWAPRRRALDAGAAVSGRDAAATTCMTPRFAEHSTTADGWLRAEAPNTAGNCGGLRLCAAQILVECHPQQCMHVPESARSDCAGPCAAAGDHDVARLGSADSGSCAADAWRTSTPSTAHKSMALHRACLLACFTARQAVLAAALPWCRSRRCRSCAATHTGVLPFPGPLL